MGSGLGGRSVLLWGLGAAALLVTAVSAVVFVHDYDAETADLVSSLRRHRAIHETLTALLDDELAEAEFLATGDMGAWARVHVEHERAQDALASSFDEADPLLRALDLAVDARVGWTAEVLELAAAGDAEAARARVRTGEGAARLEVVRAELGGLERAEEDRVESHVRAVAVRRQRVGVALTAGAILAIVIAVASLASALRDARSAGARARQAEEREGRLRQLADAAADLVRLVETGGRTTYVSPSAMRLLGRTPEDVARIGDDGLVPDDDRPLLARAVAALEKAHSVPLVLHRFRHADGTLRWFETRLLPIHDDEGRLVSLQSSSHDVHERTVEAHAREERHSLLVVEAEGLREASHTDPLTGLLNRRGLLERGEPLLDAERRAGRTTAVLFGDLDGLKDVNDRKGHDAGDRMLRATADAVRAIARDGDLCARVGGDELVVVAPGCDEDGARSLSARLAAALARHRDEEFVLAMSVGHTLAVPGSKESLDELVSAADARMYETKRRRKSAVRAAR